MSDVYKDNARSVNYGHTNNHVQDDRKDIPKRQDFKQFYEISDAITTNKETFCRREYNSRIYYSDR